MSQALRLPRGLTSRGHPYFACKYTLFCISVLAAGPQRRSLPEARPLPSWGLRRKSSISHTILLSLCYRHLAFVSRMIYDNCVGFESITETAWNPFCVQRLLERRMWACAPPRPPEFVAGLGISRWPGDGSQVGPGVGVSG